MVGQTTSKKETELAKDVFDKLRELQESGKKSEAESFIKLFNTSGPVDGQDR